MTRVEFYTKLQPIAKEALDLKNNYMKMSASEQATKTIKTQEEFNKLFGEAVLDDMVGQRINILV